MWWQKIDGKLFLWAWQDVEQLISAEMVKFMTETERDRVEGEDFVVNAQNVSIKFRITETIYYEGELVTYRCQRIAYEYPDGYGNEPNGRPAIRDRQDPGTAEEGL